ncbi:MAG: cell division protein ZapA [Bacteroidales bacterium]|nr:cell division protein ZapA [Bacteroidales bacterium]
MTDSSLTIKIDILQRPYSVRVRREDEEIFRQAGTLIEESVQRYAAKGAVYRDKQDLLAMALLESTVSAIRNKKAAGDAEANGKLLEKLKDINEYLSANLD